MNWFSHRSDKFSDDQLTVYTQVIYQPVTFTFNVSDLKTLTRVRLHGTCNHDYFHPLLFSRVYRLTVTHNPLCLRGSVVLCCRNQTYVSSELRINTCWLSVRVVLITFWFWPQWSVSVCVPGRITNKRGRRPRGPEGPRGFHCSSLSFSNPINWSPAGDVGAFQQQ